MLKVEELKEELKSVISVGEFPASGVFLSAAIVKYVREKGEPRAPTISYILGPASGTGWASLITKASSKGVADYIISDGIAAEFSGSSKVVPATHGVQTLPMSFDTSVKVADMSQMTDYDQVWEAISKAIIEFFKPEII